MPVKSGGLDPARELFGLLLPHFDPEKEKVGIDDDPSDHMQSMQAGDRKIDRVKIAGRRKMVVFEFMAIFETFDDQKTESQQDGERHV